MRASRTAIAVWSVVVLVTALRAVFSATLPMTGDEAYYWEWSRRLAGGYADHPPAVAFAIAAFSWLGRTPFAVRLPFVLFGLGTAIASAGAARVLTGERRAGWIAALAISLAPLMNVAFGTVSPDGPFVFAWALSLYCGARAFRSGSWPWFAALGGALGFALLSRFFGVALVFGIACAACSPHYRRHLLPAAASILVAIAVWLPFLLWNASHAWISFTFSLVQRHEAHYSLARPFLIYVLAAIGFSPGLWIAATMAALRPREALVSWTALPLSVLLFVLSLRETVEVYWFFGPFVSLAAAIAMSFVRLDPRRRERRGTWMFAPAAILCAIVFFAGIAPGAVYAAARRAGLHLNNGGPFEVFTYPRLARDVRAITLRAHADAMTDGYGFSSVLDFYGGLRPVLIGYDAQGQEARRWFSDADDPRRLLFVDKVPLARRADFTMQLLLACKHVHQGPVLTYPLAANDRSVPPRQYYTTWCDGTKPDSIQTLRWNNSVKITP